MSKDINLVPVSVRIRSFQSIEDEEFEVRGFTCITGKTNIGKSAVIRAISGALQNAPVVGDVRKGSKFCSVTLKSGNWGFRWEKGEKGGGTYYIDGMDRPLDKIGQGQIEEIAKLGFGTIEVGDDHIQPWLAHQWEPLFLLNRSGPAVTDFISGVSRLHVLQDAIALSLRGKKRSLDAAKLRAESIEKLKVRESAVAGLDAMIRVSQELEAQSQSIEEYKGKIAKAEALLVKMNQAKLGVEMFSPVLAINLPEAPPEPLNQRLRDAYAHWKKCDSAAKSIIAIRGVSSISISESPNRELDLFKKASKHSVIFGLKKVVDAIKNIGTITIPESGVGDEFRKLQKASSHLKKIQSCTKAVQVLESNTSIPTLPDDPGKLILAQKYHDEISALKQEIEEFEKKYEEVTQELALVNEEIAKIPSCTMCGRPVVNRHSHTSVKSA